MNEILTCFFTSEEGKLTTSQDASCKYVVEETTDAGEESPAAPQAASSSLEQRYGTGFLKITEVQVEPNYQCFT